MSDRPFRGLEPGTQPAIPPHPKHGPEEVAYWYVDANGVPLFVVCRYAIEDEDTGEPDKTFLQGRPTGSGWKWNLRGVVPVLYRLDEVAEHLATGSRAPIYMTEGEKACDRLRDYLRANELPGVVTTSPMGAGNWRDSYTDALHGARHVIVVADLDEPGRRHALAIAQALRPHVDRLEVKRPAIDVEHAGVDDHLDAGLGLDELLELEADQAAEEAPAPFAIEVRTTRELAALPDPPGSDEVLGPLVVRRQRLVLGGHTGEGKTTLVLAMAGAVGFGGAFLEWTAQPGRVLVIDAEQGLRTIKRRIAEAGLAECDAVDYARVPDGLSLDKDVRHIAAVEELIEAGDYALVIADPLYKLHSGDSNAEREAVDLMRRIDAWRELYGFALALPVHCRKPVPGSPFSIHDLFGSSAYVRGAEVVLGLQRVSDGYSRLHFLKDRDGDLPIGDVWGLLFDRELGFRRDPHDGEERDLDADVDAFLAEHDPSTVDEIAAGVHARAAAVRELLKGNPARYCTVKPPPGRAANAKPWTLSEGARPGSGTSGDEPVQEALPSCSSGDPIPPLGEGSRDEQGRPLVPEAGRPASDDDVGEVGEDGLAWR